MLRVNGRGALEAMVVAACFLSIASSLTIPGMDPACGALGPGECMARVSKCKLVKELAKGKGGYVKPILDCSTTLGIPKMQVVGKIGPAFAMGQPETIVDRVTNDSALLVQLHQCVYKANGLVAPDGTIARQSMINKLMTRGIYTHPSIIDNVAAALAGCPEPPPTKVEDYLECVRSTCIQHMSPAVSALPTFGLEDDDDDDKKCKGKKCKKH